MMCTTDIALSLVGDDSPHYAYDKSLLMRSLLTNNQSQGGTHSDLSLSEQQAAKLFTPFSDPHQPFLLQVSHLPLFGGKQVSVLLSAVQRLKNFALISASDRDWRQVSRGDQH